LEIGNFQINNDLPRLVILKNTNKRRGRLPQGFEDYSVNLILSKIDEMGFTPPQKLKDALTDKMGKSTFYEKIKKVEEMGRWVVIPIKFGERVEYQIYFFSQREFEKARTASIFAFFLILAYIAKFSPEIGLEERMLMAKGMERGLKLRELNRLENALTKLGKMPDSPMGELFNSAVVELCPCEGSEDFARITSKTPKVFQR
jgi:hypothetical protein